MRNFDAHRRSSTVISPLVIKLEASSDKISDDLERGEGANHGNRVAPFQMHVEAVAPFDNKENEMRQENER